MKYLFHLLLFTLFFSFSCQQQPPRKQNGLEVSTSPSISVQGQRFIDTRGRQVILHGINLIDKNKKDGYLPKVDASDFEAFKEWGFNCIRLGIIWDGIEPEPGKYNEHYLQGIDRFINWAAENSIYVVLDMHQDLFSVLFSDGAPAWATLTDGQRHFHNSPVWSDAYFSSPAVQSAFDHFWDNSPAPYGIGIQDHYANLWQLLANRYKNNTTVIGYDLMNEPFVGSEAQKIQAIMFQSGASLLSQMNPKRGFSPEALMQRWDTPDGRSEILKQLENIDLYSRLLAAIQPYYEAFERTKLMAMYQRVAHAIRQVGDRHIIFLETTIASNMGVYSGLQPLSFAGQRDPQQAYAPHGYDLVTDTREVASPANARVALIFSRHGETAKRLAMPMLVGEWGAYGLSSSALPAARFVSRQFEKLQCSDTYWAFEKGVEKTNYFSAIQRPYPQAIAGTLQSYHFDPDKNTFTCVWQEGKITPNKSIIYLPDWCAKNIKRISLTPDASKYHIEPTLQGAKSGYLTVAPTGHNRKLTIEFQHPL